MNHYGNPQPTDELQISSINYENDSLSFNIKMDPIFIDSLTVSHYSFSNIFLVLVKSNGKQKVIRINNLLSSANNDVDFNYNCSVNIRNADYNKFKVACDLYNGISSVVLNNSYYIWNISPYRCDPFRIIESPLYLFGEE